MPCDICPTFTHTSDLSQKAKKPFLCVGSKQYYCHFVMRYLSFMQTRQVFAVSLQIFASENKSANVKKIVHPVMRNCHLHMNKSSYCATQRATLQISMICPYSETMYFWYPLLGDGRRRLSPCLCCL